MNKGMVVTSVSDVHRSGFSYSLTAVLLGTRRVSRQRGCLDCITHEGSSRKRADATRDGHSEAGDWLCRLRQCLSRSSDGDSTKKKGASPQ